MNKTIYFVRHGEGHHNANNLYSLPEFELTDRGKEQAAAAAERVKHLTIDLIVASPYKRTMQTMEIINQVINKEVITSELAVEVKRPKEIAGKRIDDPEVVKVREQLDSNFHNKHWHLSDEENFYDLKQRAEKFMKYLEGLDQDNILVVSHAVFIKMLGLTLVLGDQLTPQGFLNAYHSLGLATSGLTLFQIRDKGWKLITWNDQSHLGE